MEARALLKVLFGKLDALSHFHYAPRPVVADLSMRPEVPALALEDVTSQVRHPLCLDRVLESQPLL